MNIFPTNADLTPSKRVKFGIDPTFPRLHLGHFIPLRLIKQMKENGHEVTVVIGTFTAQLGDPSGRNATRPILSVTEVEENAISIMNTVKEFLGEDTVFFQNAEMHNKMSLPIFLRDVVSQFTLTHMTSRNEFANRIANNQPVAIHELLVPILQGMDSVHLNTEIEIGGQDQLFNFQIARQLQANFGQKPQACMMLPIINGTDGRKMSKSFGNCIFLDEPANDIFGKTMRISDNTMLEWFPLLTDASPKDFSHPMEAKKFLAFEIVRQLSDLDVANLAQGFFEQTVQNKKPPNEIPEIMADNWTLIRTVQEVKNSSANQAHELIKCGAVKINGEVCREKKRLVLRNQIIQVGKRDFVKIT